MRTTSLVAITFAALVAAGCGSTPEEEPAPSGMQEVAMPSWYDTTRTADEGEGMIYGYGMGESSSRRLAVESAQAEGRRAIAGYIATEAAGLIEESTTEMGSEARETARAAFETFVDQRVHGIRPDRSALYKDEDDNFVAYYRMAVDQALFDEMLDEAMESEQVAEELGPDHQEAMESLKKRREAN
ncbi:LPP20 lipoprotein [Thiohalospira halophila DSM 15071]|uniref:LPP20 lipoprotein n=1 Tax=Thiohalospira halophila DSM 15071 TaxID=1123397 RepID=A0A1I1TSB3_9GAMM|nr:LPP20 family lipoprotein [Thiohalospira halophila]SFD61419.1 LPP20 lipoprotein [Thiohalospira halophila DSM 15071]